MLTRRSLLTAARGFSLIEILITVAIIGIVLALGMPAFNEWMRSTRIRGAADSLLSGIQLARTEAVRRNAPVFLQVNPNADELWRVGCVTVVAASATTPACPDTIARRLLTEGSLRESGSSIVSLTSDGGNRLIFDQFGRRRTAAGNPANPADFGQLDVAHATASARAQRILIDFGGAARMCDPLLPTGNLRACP